MEVLGELNNYYYISEVELIDLLSFDNDVLHDIYAAQGVPQGNVIRLPLNWWLFIRYKPFLV